MSEPAAPPESADARLSRHITEAEKDLKAIGAELAPLFETGVDISDVERRLAEALGSLMELRRELWDLRMIEPEETTASCRS